MIRAYSSWKSKISISKYYSIYIWVSINDHPYSINPGYLLFFESTIMGNTADLPTVQKMIIDTPTKRVSHRGSLLKGVSVQWVLYQSILNAKLTGRKKLDRKRCTSNRDDHKLENTVKQSWFKHLGDLHKEWTEAGVSASRSRLCLQNQRLHFQERGPRIAFLGPWVLSDNATYRFRGPAKMDDNQIRVWVSNVNTFLFV